MPTKGATRSKPATRRWGNGTLKIRDWPEDIVLHDLAVLQAIPVQVVKGKANGELRTVACAFEELDVLSDDRPSLGLVGWRDALTQFNGKERFVPIDCDVGKCGPRHGASRPCRDYRVERLGTS